MDISIRAINEFRQYFSGNMDAYGVHIPGEATEGSPKKKGQSFTKTAPITEEVYIAHLEGKTGLGIVPFRPDGTINFCVIDIDTYDTDHIETINLIYNSKLPMIPFRSKSGGLHIYTFFSEPVQANKAIKMLGQIKSLMGLPKKTELFPKQTEAKEGAIGNWINLPYFNVAVTKQYALNSTGQPMEFDEMLRAVADKRCTFEQFEEAFKNLPLSDAPPCIQSIYLRRKTDFHNNFLFNIAVYYKAALGDDFEDAVIDANRLLDRPHDLQRLNDTVLSSVKKRHYTYKCNEEPICSLCDKAECRKRKFGIGGSEVTEMDFGELIQYTTDPPYYEWKVDGKSLKFFDEDDIIKQSEFQKLCFRTIHKLPQTLAKPVWTAIVNNSLKNIVVKNINAEEDCSPGSMFMEYLTEFLTRRAPADNKRQILTDRVYKDEEYRTSVNNVMPVYIFRIKNLVNFLTVTKNFKAYTNVQIHERLVRLGAFTVRYNVGGEAGTARAWAIPVTAVKPFTQEAADDVETSFMDKMEGEDY